MSDVSGNSLFHPELQANLGIGYLQDIGNLKINYRLDYSYQGERYLRVFNLPSDVLEAWDELGAQITLSSSDDSWFVQFYGQNITDNNSDSANLKVFVKDLTNGNFTLVSGTETDNAIYNLSLIHI